MSPFPARLAATALLALTVAACDDSAPDAAPQPSPVPSDPAAPAPSVAGSGSATVAATQLCDFLRKKLPDWKSVGGENAAQAQLAVDLFTFYQEQGATPVGREIDELTRTQCPAIRFDVLQTAGIDNFLIL